jgi:hypothetical protein
MAITIAQINSAIHDTFANNLTTIDYTQDYDNLTEGLANTPLLQVYWNTLNPVSEGSSTDRRTFSGGSKPIRTKRYLFNVDLYLDPRSDIDRNFSQMLPIVDEINDILEEQDEQPYFGLAGIQSYTWSCQRGNIEYAQVLYPVVQWVIEIYVF